MRIYLAPKVGQWRVADRKATHLTKVYFSGLEHGRSAMEAKGVLVVERSVVVRPVRLFLVADPKHRTDAEPNFFRIVGAQWREVKLRGTALEFLE